MLNQLTLILIVAFLGICHAEDLLFFEPGSCNENRPNVGCHNQPTGACCYIGAPWCGSLSCNNCPKGTATWVYGGGGCGTTPPDPAIACIEPGNGAHCCTDLGNAPTCNFIWFTDSPAKRDELAMRALTADGPQNCSVKHEPNKMGFMDDEGVKHEIHMPKGTFSTATQHYMDRNWAELHKFPGWGEFFSHVLWWAWG